MIKILKNLQKKDYIYAFFSIIFIIIGVFLDLKMPDYMANITKIVEADAGNIKSILKEGSFMLMCAMGSLISSFITCYLVSQIASLFSMNMRRKVFEKVENLSREEINKFEVSSLITRTTNDITQIQMFLAMGLQMLIKAPITAVWAIFKILDKSIEWSLLTLFAVIILLTAVSIIMKKVMPKFKIVQQLIDKVNSLIRENLNGIRVVRAYNAEKYEEEKFAKVNSRLTNQQLYNQKNFNYLVPIMYLVMNTLSLLIYYVGAILIDGATLGIKINLFGDMIVFSSYAMQVIMSFLMLAMTFMILPRADASAKRINEVLFSTSTIKDGHLTNNINDIHGSIEFKNVSFKYPGADECILENISFKANKGETVAFIGSTGSGKSTLVNLIPRFYDATEGEVLVNGVNVKDYEEEYLNSIIGYVPQKAVMFSRSVKDNISYGRCNGEKVSDDAISKGLKLSCSSSFVNKLPSCENYHVSEGGTNLSGGQKQRLSIARTIARNPEIYIFDDSFSALDYKTDRDLRSNLKKYTKEATTLIVAQRIGTILHADKIIVLDKGKCVGVGTHSQLIKNCSIYREIALSQVTEEELKNA